MTDKEKKEVYDIAVSSASRHGAVLTTLLLKTAADSPLAPPVSSPVAPRSDTALAPKAVTPVAPAPARTAKAGPASTSSPAATKQAPKQATKPAPKPAPKPATKPSPAGGNKEQPTSTPKNKKTKPQKTSFLDDNEKWFDSWMGKGNGQYGQWGMYGALGGGLLGLITEALSSKEKKNYLGQMLLHGLLGGALTAGGRALYTSPNPSPAAASGLDVANANA